MKQTTKTVTRIFQARVPSHALQALQLQSSHRLVTSYLLVTLDSLLTLDIQRFPRIRRPWPELVLHETILNFISSNLAKIKTIQNSAQTKSKFMAVPGNINSGWWVWIARTAGPCVIQTAGLLDFIFSTDCLHCLAFLSFCCSTPLLRLTFSGLGSTTSNGSKVSSPSSAPTIVLMRADERPMMALKMLN